MTTWEEALQLLIMYNILRSDSLLRNREKISNKFQLRTCVVTTATDFGRYLRISTTL